MGREILIWNRNKEMSLIEDCLRNYSFIAIDFPGALRETPQHATDDERYTNMSFSVDRTNFILDSI